MGVLINVANRTVCIYIIMEMLLRLQIPKVEVRLLSKYCFDISLYIRHRKWGYIINLYCII